LRAIAPLEQAGLEVKDVVVLVDREQGGAEELAQMGYTLRSVLRLTEMLDILVEDGRITPGQQEEVTAFLAGGKGDA
jgi:uridine monophosphate synthetase